jgi:hypothetical protein
VWSFVSKENVMMQRVSPLAAAVAVVLFVSAVIAADKADKSDSKVMGTITKVGDGTLTVTDKDGKDHALTVAKDAKIQCDGKDCKLADLDPKKVTAVTVTLNPNHNDVAQQIDAKTTK